MDRIYYSKFFDTFTMISCVYFLTSFSWFFMGIEKHVFYSSSLFLLVIIEFLKIFRSLSLRHPKLTKARWKLTYSWKQHFDVIVLKSFSAFSYYWLLNLTQTHSKFNIARASGWYQFQWGATTLFFEWSTTAVDTVRFLEIRNVRKIPPKKILRFILLLCINLRTRSCAISNHSYILYID